jgi:hypothetical protein
MAKQNDRASEMEETSEIGGAPLITSDESAIVLQPGKEPFDFPAALIATERAPILGEIDPVRTMRGDQFDAAGGERLVKAIAVIGRVADEPRGIVSEEAGV